MDDALEVFDSHRAGRRLAEFIDDLSNWYVRRSRRRFWNGDQAALATLHECLDTLTRLLAPLTPFITERVWQALMSATDPAAPRSVHLATWPRPTPERVDERLSRQMRTVRSVVEVGRAARAGSGVKIRQPLRRALVTAPGWENLSEELRAEIAEELNVAGLGAMGEGSAVVDLSVRPQFRAIGKRFGPRTQQVVQAVRAAEPAATAAALRTSGQVGFELDGERVTLGPDEVEVVETPRTDWHVATDGAVTVAFDLEITPELRRAGQARDLIRWIQQTRKDIGLQVTDRVNLSWYATGELADAILEHRDAIAREVLAVSFDRRSAPIAATADPEDLASVVEIVRA